MPVKVLMAGYLGAGNFGDDALMYAFASALPDDYEVSALSGQPEETYRLYRIPSVPRRDMRAIDEAIAKCDVLVFPGGSIFQDVTSVRSVAYYSTLVKKAKAARKKVVLLSQGIGPLTTYFGKRFALQAFNLCDAIVVRDPQSAQTLRDMGARTNIHLAADLAMLLPLRAGAEAFTDFNVGSMGTVGIAPRPVSKGFDTVGVFGEFCRLVYQSGTMPVLIPMDKNVDIPLIEEITKRQGGRIPDLRKAQTPMQIQERISRMDSVVAMRLHAGILAASVGVPPLMVSYDPKVAAFARMVEVAPALPIENLTPQRLLDTFLAFQKDRERNARIMERKREELFNLAQKNIDVLMNTMGTSAKI